MSIEHAKLERVLKALSNKRRLAILKFIRREKEASVGDIAQAIRLSLKSTSRHLIVLFSADIVDKEQRSSEMYYKIVTPISSTVSHILSLL